MQNQTDSTTASLDALFSLMQNLEENFISLGSELSTVKRYKLYRFKGYDTFKDLIACEYSFSTAIANRLVAIYQKFVEELDVYSGTLIEIGYERLSLILPVLRKADVAMCESWLKLAQQMDARELKATIKANKAETKELSMKDVLVMSWLERMTCFFNCNKKELLFKLALFFSAPTKNNDEYFAMMKSDIRGLQKSFEEALSDPDATNSFVEACQSLCNDPALGVTSVEFTTPGGSHTVASQKTKGESNV